ncbi:DNA alkylation repair protein [Microbacterium telephonicum]|uniref:3-methyladenine DNA glycosylase AlkD n=1 Tax=Microbacterium telephonicum TaxID=1714841 RepID=A0A498C3I9_9MICO|nr:DNA alkylation repair protein [Microbacterium telephonicum]RLK49156.1 3-methyladenine DNA glycosylase AlkD [Microbacterium telephonicum]
MNAARLADDIRAALREVADPARAPGQQAYMKSAMPFLGVPVPESRRMARALAKDVTDGDVLADAASALWDEATHREERYAALALLALPPLRRDPALVALLERFTVEGAWWDFTDELAHRVAELLDTDPVPMAAQVRAWAHSPDMWLRRLAVIAQLGRRERVDRMLLADVIEANLDDGEFFIRKAIGWALRDHARVAPDWVRAFVAAHPLSSLSTREALKHL